MIVEGASAAEQRVYTVDEAVSLARALQEDGLSASAAAKEAANISGIKKGDIYKQMLEK